MTKDKKTDRESTALRPGDLPVRKGETDRRVQAAAKLYRASGRSRRDDIFDDVLGGLELPEPTGATIDERLRETDPARVARAAAEKQRAGRPSAEAALPDSAAGRADGGQQAADKGTAEKPATENIAPDKIAHGQYFTPGKGRRQDPASGGMLTGAEAGQGTGVPGTPQAGRQGGPRSGSPKGGSTQKSSGTRFLKRTTGLSQRLSGEVEEKVLRRIDPARCRPWERHNRDYALLTEDTCRDLIDGLKAQGKQEFPAIVRRIDEPDFDYEIICGARRHFAVSWLRANNYPQFAYLIEERELTDEEAFRLADIENRERDDLSDYERAIDYADAVKRYYGGRQNRMAERLEVATPWLSRYLQLAKLPKKVVAAFASVRDIKERPVRKLRPLLNDPEAAARLYEEAALLAYEQAAARAGQGAFTDGLKVVQRLVKAGKGDVGSANAQAPVSAANPQAGGQGSDLPPTGTPPFGLAIGGKKPADVYSPPTRRRESGDAEAIQAALDLQARVLPATRDQAYADQAGLPELLRRFVHEQGGPDVAPVVTLTEAPAVTATPQAGRPAPRPGEWPDDLTGLAGNAFGSDGAGQEVTGRGGRRILSLPDDLTAEQLRGLFRDYMNTYG